MTTFNFVQFHEQIKDLEPHVKGRKFEEMLIQWFENHPDWADSIESIHMREDDPRQLFPEDIGVDLVVYLKDGRVGAVQAKCYQQHTTLTLNDGNLATWFAASGHRDIDFRILVATAAEVGRHVKTVIHNDAKQTIIYLYQDLVDAGVQWNVSDDELKITPREKLELRDYQQDCVDTVLNHFRANNTKALITPFCGTGKTLMFFKTWEAMHTSGMTSGVNRPIVLFSAPLLSLCDQHLKEHAIQAHCPHDYLAVASDHRLDDGSKENLEQYDFGRTIVTEDPLVIRDEMLRHTDRPLFIMACYDSVEKIAKAQEKGAPAVDFSCNDEAHTQMKCLVKDTASSCVFVSDSKPALAQSYQLNMTATPRCIIGPLRQQAEERGALALNYRKEEYFGKHVFSFSAKRARQVKVNCPYQVYVGGYTTDEVYGHINANEILAGGGFDNVEAQDVAKVASFLKLLKKLNEEKQEAGCRKNAMALIVGNSNKNIATYLDLLNEVNLRLPAEQRVDNLLTLQVTGEDSQRRRRMMLSHFETEGNTVVLGHCRTLGMGIDCPSIDVVAFMDPADEETRIIQNVGRALRMDRTDNPDKTARVFIPVFFSEGETPEQRAAAGRFNVVSKVLCGLCEHDDDWVTYMTQARIEGRKLRRQRQNFNPRFNILECDIPFQIEMLDFIEQISAEVLNAELGSDYSLIEELSDWNRQQGERPGWSPNNELEMSLYKRLYAFNQKIEGGTVSSELLDYAQELLPEDYFETHQTRTTRLFELIKSYKEHTGEFCPASYEVDGHKVGYALSNARRGKNKSLAGLLDSEFGDDWKILDVSVESIFQLIQSWKEDNEGFPNSKCMFGGVNIGRHTNEARKGLNEPLSNLLDAEYGDSWRATKVQLAPEVALQAIVAWKNAHGTFPPAKCVADGIRVGGLLNSARKGGNKALAALLDEEYGDTWKRAFAAPEVVFQLIREWKKDNDGFPRSNYKVDGISVGATMYSARRGLNRVLADLLDAEYGDAWRQVNQAPKGN